MKNLSCGIDFGTSNSAVAVSDSSGVSLVELEGGSQTIPSAIFFNTEEKRTVFGRQAIDEYLEQYSGRFMRSLKSILGSDLMKESTIIGGKSMGFSDVIGCFIGEIKRRSEENIGRELTNVVLGRPVHFVDDDKVADTRAENELKLIAEKQGFKNIAFEFEPIAAARDYESHIEKEELVLVVDIGGGTSDFSVVKLSPKVRDQIDRSKDILANAGVHIGGTDFDKRFSLDVVMPHLGYGSLLKNNLEAPKAEFHMLATWHLINFLYTQKNKTAVKNLYNESQNRDLIKRFVQVLDDQRGHDIAAQVELAKIRLSDYQIAMIDLEFIEDKFVLNAEKKNLVEATKADVQKIITTAVQTVEQGARVSASEIDTIFMTGGSTALPGFIDNVCRAFPDSRIIQGDRFSSVAKGLGVSAARIYQ